MDQAVSTSLCGLSLAKAATVIGITHSIIFGGLYLYETAYAIYDWMILLSPPGLLAIVNNFLMLEMFTNEAFLCFVASLSLLAGAYKIASRCIKMDQAVSTSLCGLSLAKAATVIGITHSIIFGGLYLYETAYAIYDWMILLSPPGLLAIVNNFLMLEMFTNEAFLCFVASLSLLAGAYKSKPGLILTWLLQQAVMIFSSLLTLFYFVVSAYLRTPWLNCFFQLFLTAIEAYIFAVVYSYFLELRRGNLVQGDNRLVN